MPKSFDLDIEELSEKISEKIVNDIDFERVKKEIVKQAKNEILEKLKERD